MSKKGEKHCAGCKDPKPLNEFYKNKTYEDGHSIYCKECTKMKAKGYYQKKIAKEVIKVEKPVSFIETALKLAMTERYLLNAVQLLQEIKYDSEPSKNKVTQD